MAPLYRQNTTLGIIEDHVICRNNVQKIEEQFFANSLVAWNPRQMSYALFLDIFEAISSALFDKKTKILLFCLIIFGLLRRSYLET